MQHCVLFVFIFWYSHTLRFGYLLFNSIVTILLKLITLLLSDSLIFRFYACSCACMYAFLVFLEQHLSTLLSSFLLVRHLTFFNHIASDCLGLTNVYIHIYLRVLIANGVPNIYKHCKLICILIALELSLWILISLADLSVCSWWFHRDIKRRGSPSSC